MKLSCVPMADYPGDLWLDWDELNQSYCDSHPLLQSRFVEPLTRHFPSDIEVLAAYESDKCMALMLMQSARGVIQSSYLPSQSQMALALTPEAFPSVFEQQHGCVPAKVLRMDVFSIDPRYQSGIARLSGLELIPKSTDAAIDCSGDFDNYWAQRPKNLRKNISRYINRANKELGGYTLKIATNKQHVAEAVDRYGLLESEGWKGESGTALHPDNVQGRYYREIMQSFAESGNAYVFELWTGGEMVASRLLVGNDNILVVLKTTYSEPLKHYAFGRLLFYETIKFVFENRLAPELDLYTDATKEQLDWSTHSRKFYNGSLYRRGVGSVMKQAIKFRRLVANGG